MTSYGTENAPESNVKVQSDKNGGGSLSEPSIALISINTMLGPGLLAIPYAFQSAGWIFSDLGLVAGGLITADVACLFASGIQMTRKHADEYQSATDDEETSLTPAEPPATWEFAALARFLSGPKLEKVSQLFLALGLVSLACAQIIVTAQAMDGFLVWVFGKTYAIEVVGTPLISTDVLSVMPFPANTWGVSLGFVIDAFICVTLGLMDLSDNIIPQYVFFAMFNFAVLVFLAHFFNPDVDQIVHGDGRLPNVGHDLGGVLGIVIFNYAYIVAVPSLRSDSKQDVNFNAATWGGVAFMMVMYIVYGYLGALSFPQVADNLLVSILQPEVPSITKAAVFALSFAFVPAIPVYVILLARSIEDAGISERLSTILANLIPWTIALLCYMQSWFSIIITWSGLLVLGFINYNIPLLLILLAFYANKHGKVGTAGFTSLCAFVWESDSWQVRRSAGYFILMTFLIIACIIYNVALLII